jgi:23S rRNA (cytidine2498-2'-O)-methyltransferase
MLTAYLAPVDLEEPLESELKNIIARHGRIFLAEGPIQKAYWAQNIWIDAQIIPFTSISDGAKKLKALQRLWAYYPNTHIRRGQLIAEQLPYFAPKPLAFPSPIPTAPLGSWTLLDENTLLAAAQCTSPFANGEVHFQETKEPPSRAYLKLWEILTRIGHAPKKGERCLEAGASPGSWTWALHSLGAEVIAVDRAELAPEIARLPQVQFLKKDAFSLHPKDLPPLDWVFSDVICYPEKLLEWVSRWKGARLVCTIKFQGKGDYAIVKEFEKIEGSQIFHLHHNKHELTWVSFSSKK